MERLVSSFCDAQTYSFDAEKKEYYICGFAWIIEPIPRYKYLKLKYKAPDGVRIKSFLLNLEACEDLEIYEDPNVVREVF
uniref:Uncharacterized protein n=1 Tax=Oryza punctata TaxID=4537 RepID=A0A0E0L0L1_ORYPU